MPTSASSATADAGPMRLASWVVLLAATATLVFSYTLPTVEFTQLGSDPEIYSIWGGIEMLWLDGTPLLAAIVFLFSMVFPVAKLLALAGLLRRSPDAAHPKRSLLWVEVLGKWSMLDVLIVGAFVGAIRLRLGPNLQLAKGLSHPGILVFAGAIALSMLATRIVARALLTPEERWPVARRSTTGDLARVVSTVAAGALVMALIEPLFEVSKGFIFRNEVQLPLMSWRMGQEGEQLLAASLLGFVVALPVLRSLAALWLRWLGGGRRIYRLTVTLDEWAMLDVFALGMLVVFTKLEQLATTAVMAGFWWTLAAAALAQLDAWLIRRESREA
jgi:paraquat-inducible protein A